MNWEDVIMSVACLIFCGALVPQILKNYKQKTAEQISWIYLGLYVIGLFLLEIGFIGLKSWGVSILNGVTIIAYFIFGFQKFYYKVYYKGKE